MDKRPETQVILDSFRRIVRVLRESSRAAEQRVGLTGAQLFVMQTLARHPQLSVNELADRTRTHQSTVSVVVSKLVERGLVRRESSTSDARRVVLALTPEGKTLLRRAPDAAQERLIAAIEGLPGSARVDLSHLLVQLVEIMDAADEEPGMLFDDLEPARKRKRTSS
jgi:DNA-binding MarR family transcriptional regulator